MAAALYVLLLVIQFLFLFKKDVLCVTKVVQVLHLRLKYTEAKIQMLLFSWKLAQPRSRAAVRQNEKFVISKSL